MARRRVAAIKALGPLLLVQVAGLALLPSKVEICSDQCVDLKASWSAKCSWSSKECSACGACAAFRSGEAGFLATADTRSECMPPGQLLFLHIMKNGGTSVDQFMACQCKRAHCGSILSLGPIELHEGDHTCDQPSVCSTHGRYADRGQLCGADFERPSKVFTVMRHPVDRVFSMYNYQKKQLYDKGRTLAPLSEVLRDCQAGGKEGLATAWLCAQLVNHMTAEIFAPSESHGINETLNSTHLDYAKGIVKNLDAIFYLEDFSNFATAFASSNLLPVSADCNLKHSNPTVCETCHDAPTKDEEDIIEETNMFDIQLYEWAKNLPNRYHS